MKIKKLSLLLGLWLTISYGVLASNQQPFMIDTDMGPDDWQAIAYLLNQPSIQVKSITITATGEVNCKQGLRNLAGLLTTLDRRDIPIGCGPQQTISKPGYQFPQIWKDRAANMLGIKLPINNQVTIAKSAIGLIINTLKHSKQPITIVHLGPWTNLAQAYLRYPYILKKKIKIIYATDGIFRPSKVNYEPGTKQKYFRGTWNLHIDPAAGQTLFASGIPIALITTDARTTLNRYGQILIEHIYAALIANHKSKASNLIYQILTPKVGARFIGDQSTAVIALYPAICRWEYLPLKVLNHPAFRAGETIISHHGSPLKICLHIDKHIFSKLFIAGLTRIK